MKGKLLAISALLIIFSSCGSSDATIHTNSKSAYLSARDLKIQLEKGGYSFESPYAVNDTTNRLTGTDMFEKIHITLFYKNDTVNNVQILQRFSTNREEFEQHIQPFETCLSVIDTASFTWLKNILLHHQTAKDFTVQSLINNRQYELNYFANVDKDVLSINIITTQ